MIKYIGLSKDGQDFVAGATKSLNGMVSVGAGYPAYMKTWRRNLLDPDTLQNGPVTITEHPDQYVKVGDDYYLFTSLQIIYPSRIQNAFEWSNNWNNGWYDSFKGQLWPPRNAQIQALPTPTGAVPILENVWLTGAAEQWLGQRQGAYSIVKQKQVKIPDVPGEVKLGRYLVPMQDMMTMEPTDALVEEQVDKIMRFDGLYFVFLKLMVVTPDVTPTPIATEWCPGTLMDKFYDRSMGVYDSMVLEELTVDPSWIVDNT